MPPTQARARAAIQDLIAKYTALTDDGRKTTSESGVVHQFIDPLLRALGWPVDDPARYKYELATQAGRPDMTLFPERGGLIFVEAKRFGKIQELEQARKTITGIVTPGQLALPGMATDRTAEEQQAINYAFQNGGTWAVLTNFEKLRLFNARRDWLVLSFETPRAYLDQFDLLWQLSYESVINGELDLLSDQRHREDVDTNYLNFINEWRERLARDILAHPAANPWALTAAGQVNLAELRAVVQRVLDRLVVVRFAEDHLIAPAGTLYSLFEINRRNPYTFSLAQFFAQLFRRFDELHNSALFSPGLADQAVFSDDVLAGLIQKLYEARYRAMSADIMGNTYEQYLGKALALTNGAIETRDNLETRKKQGSYYTPQVIVRYLVDRSLGRYLYGTVNGRPDGEPVAGERRQTAAGIRDLRVLDSASGSGSFLIYAYQVLADFYRSEIERLAAELAAKADELAGQGLSPIDIRIELATLRSEHERLQEYPRLIVEQHLYGVDLDPQAAEIATVNLIMQAMADQRGPKKRLPLILNQNIKVGNALIGAGPTDPRLAEHAAALAELRRLRQQLLTEIDSSDHTATMQAIAATAGQVNAALNAPLQAWFEDPAGPRPFNWAVEFPEVFVAEQGQPLPNPGFAVVIGNPPWEIVKPDLREYYAQFDPAIESKLTRRQVEQRLDELNADQKIAAGWQAQVARIEAQAAYYKASPDFTRQNGGDTATHKLFLERAYSLLASEGRLGYVIPSGIYSDLGTKELREMLLNEGRIEYLYNFSNERYFFPDVDHRFQFTLLGAQRGEQSNGFWTAFRFDPRIAVKPEELPTFLANRDNLVHVQRESLRRFSPDSLSLMEFQTQRDYDVTERLYGSWPLIGERLEAGWIVRLNNEFHMTNDRHLFNQTGGPIPVYNGRMIHQFDAYFAPHEFWVDKNKVSAIKENTAEQIKYFRIGYRRIARSTDSRTLIAAVIPSQTICDTVAIVENVGQLSNGLHPLFLCSVFNSFCLDYVLRQKVATTINMFYVYQLPLPRLTAGNPYFEAIVPRAARLTCTTPAFAALWQEVMGQPWDETKGATDPAQRQQLRNELDALVAHLYGLNRADFAHILGTFPLVFPPTPEGAAKKDALLAEFDRWASVVADWARK
ncbi:MAG: hypothetical protein FOGNACKC_02197 [Anaerolineae bacterium]|nr:hypothetical protein [Anaerolineae bacterium]